MGAALEQDGIRQVNENAHFKKIRKWAGKAV